LSCRWLEWGLRIKRIRYGLLHKTKPIWQDLIVLIIVFLVTILCLSAHTIKDLCWSFPLVAGYLLGDMLTYHAKVLWFDDLRPNLLWQDLRVCSHRRTLFQGLINFVESIFLFGILYRYYGHIDNQQAIYRESFKVATTFSSEILKAPSLQVLVIIQVAVSLFFLAFVISIISSVSYTRKELAPTDKD